MKARDFKSRETGPDPRKPGEITGALWGCFFISSGGCEKAFLMGSHQKVKHNHTWELAGQFLAIISWKLNSIKSNLKIKAKCSSCLRFKMNSEENWDILDEGHKVLWEKNKKLFSRRERQLPSTWHTHLLVSWHSCLTFLFSESPRIQHSPFPPRCCGIFLPFSWPSGYVSPGLAGC